MTQIRVNYERCNQMAEVLADYSIPDEIEDASVGSMSPDQIANYYLFLVAICHQTQSLEGRISGQYIRGWDYLSAKLILHATTRPSILNPMSWHAITSDALIEIYKDADFGDTLSDSHGRARLLNDLGTKMDSNEWRSANDMYSVCKGRISGEYPSLLLLLSQFRAYDDPVRKKSYFFLGLMSQFDLWSYVDPEALGPPVDYHEVRGHLRVGTVVVVDQDLRQSLMTGAEVTEAQDLAIRMAVHDAIVYISLRSGMPSPMTLHYLFWHVFRHVCRREEPFCNSIGNKDDIGLPSRYEHFLGSVAPHACPFSSICPSVNSKPKFLEHSYSSHWY